MTQMKAGFADLRSRILPLSLTRKHWFLLGSAFVWLLCGAYAISRGGFSWRDLSVSLGRFDVSGLVGVALCAVAQLLCMTARVWWLFPSQHRVRFSRVLEGMTYGQCLNTVAPARAGDVVKILIFSRGTSSGTGVVTSVGVLLLDRLVDISALIALALYAGVLSSLLEIVPPISIRWLAIGAFGIGTISFLLLGLGQDYAAKWRDRIPNLAMGLTVLKHPLPLLLSFTVAMAGWLCEVVALELLCTSQGFALSLNQLVLVLFTLNVALAVPVSIANVGPYEAAIVFTLEKFGMSLPDSLAVATVHHWGQFAGVLAVAIAFGVGKQTKRLFW